MPAVVASSRWIRFSKQRGLVRRFALPGRFGRQAEVSIGFASGLATLTGTDDETDLEQVWFHNILYGFPVL